MKSFIFLYKTVNKINGKFYIGIHGTNNLDDGYLGSGLNLEKAIHKYGKLSFEREILKYFNSYEEAYNYEKSFITQDLINCRMCYNIASGGNGGNLVSTKGISKPAGFGLKISKAQRDPNNIKVIEGHKTAALKLKFKDKSYTKTEDFKKVMSQATSGQNNGMYGKRHSEESKQKMREKALLRGKSK